MQQIITNSHNDFVTIVGKIKWGLSHVDGQLTAIGIITADEATGDQLSYITEKLDSCGLFTEPLPLKDADTGNIWLICKREPGIIKKLAQFHVETILHYMETPSDEELKSTKFKPRLREEWRVSFLNNERILSNAFRFFGLEVCNEEENLDVSDEHGLIRTFYKDFRAFYLLKVKDLSRNLDSQSPDFSEKFKEIKKQAAATAVSKSISTLCNSFIAKAASLPKNMHEEGIAALVLIIEKTAIHYLPPDWWGGGICP